MGEIGEMRKLALAAIAILLVLESSPAAAAPNAKYCVSLHKHFDACETSQIAHHRPVKPACSNI
jgi:hypothetical protein